LWWPAGTVDCAWPSWPAYVWLWHKVIQTVGTLLRMHRRSHACVNVCVNQTCTEYYVANNVALPLDTIKFVMLNFVPLLLHVQRTDTF
jgi:hypothetical protein